jgi:plasmid maintenance system antidote protein VapI
MKRVTPLKLAIVASGRTQRDIAQEIGVDEGHLSRIVNGLHCSDPMRDALCDALGKTVDELWPASAQAAA